MVTNIFLLDFYLKCDCLDSAINFSEGDCKFQVSNHDKLMSFEFQRTGKNLCS